MCLGDFAIVLTSLCLLASVEAVSWTLLRLPICESCTDVLRVEKGLISAYSFTVYKEADLMDFVNAPVGKGLPIQDKLRPLIAGKLCLL